MKKSYNSLNTFIDWDTCKIEGNLPIYHFCNIYNGTIIGENCKIGSYVEISGAIIGNNVTISSFCFIPKGVAIQDNVWIGPGCFFTNDIYPPSPKEKWRSIFVARGARIGANVTIKAGVTIGAGAIIGCGSVVTKTIPPGEIWAGNPAVNIENKIKKKKGV